MISTASLDAYLNPALTKALHDLGVDDDTLSPAEKAQLDELGYISFGQVIPTEQARHLAGRIDVIAAQEGENAGKDFHTEAGATRLGTLINKDPGFDVCFLHPKALAAVAHIIGCDFGLSSITCRAALPGEGGQGLHCDTLIGIRAANALWMIDDFTDDNGPTRLIPGSHKFGKTPAEAIDPKADHPDQIRTLGPAGTLIVINAHTWHGGTLNRSLRTRRLVSAFFMERGKYQDIAYRKLNSASQARLSPAARAMIDFE